MRAVVDTDVIAYYVLGTPEFDSVYDTLFVELADREELALATFDKKLLTTYPSIAKRPKDLT